MLRTSHMVGLTHSVRTLLDSRSSLLVIHLVMLLNSKDVDDDPGEDDFENPK